MPIAKFDISSDHDFFCRSEKSLAEYADWLRNNLNELGMSYEDLKKSSGIPVIIIKNILDNKSVTKNEDSKLIESFTTGDRSYSEIIRNHRNDHQGKSTFSRCSNQSLSINTGIDLQRLNEITQGKSKPTEKEVHTISLVLEISGKDRQKLNNQTQEAESKLKASENNAKLKEDKLIKAGLEELAAKFNIGSKPGLKK